MPSDLSSLVHWILFLPLGAAALSALFLRRAGGLAAWLSTGVAFVIALAVGYYMPLKLTRDVRHLSRRIREIAEMLSGKDVSESALTHARALLN